MQAAKAFSVGPTHSRRPLPQDDLKRSQTFAAFSPGHKSTEVGYHGYEHLAHAIVVLKTRNIVSL